MFGTLADFDALIAEAHGSACKVMIDQVISHTSDEHPWFKESRVEPRQSPRPTGTSGPTPKPDGTPPNNWLSIFGGSAWQWDTAPPAILPAQFPRRAAGPQLPQPRGPGRAARRRALLAGARRRRLPPRHDQLLLPLARAWKTIRRCRRKQRNDSIAPSVNPYNFQDHLYDKSRPENLRVPERFRAPARRISGGRRGRRGRRRAARAGGRGGLHRRRRPRADVLLLRFPRRRKNCQRGKVRSVLEDLRQGRQRRLVVLGLLQPRRDAPRHALGRRRARQACLSQGHLGAADVAARIGLHLSGRGARPRRGRAPLRGSAGSLRHPLLAGIQGPRRLPHADGVGEGGAEWRLLHGQAVAAGSGRASSLQAVDAQAGRSPTSMLEHYRRFLAFRRAYPALRQGRHRVPRRRTATRSPSPARDGNEQIVCAFNLGAQAG